MFNPYDPAASMSQPEETAAYTPTERAKKLLAKGATLGVTNRDIQAESLLEHGIEFAGSLPTYGIAGALTAPYVGPALGAAGLARLAASPLATRVIGSAGIGALGGAVSGGVEGGLPGTAEGLVTGGLSGAVGEAGIVGAGRVLSKLRGAKTADEIVQQMTQAPSTTALAKIKYKPVEGEIVNEPNWRPGTPERPTNAKVVPDYAGRMADEARPVRQLPETSESWRPPYGEQPPQFPEAPPGTQSAPKGEAPTPNVPTNRVLDPNDKDTAIYQANIAAGRMPWDTASPKERTRLFRKYKSLPEEKPPTPAESAVVSKAISNETELPSPEMLDAATTFVPDLPPAAPLSPLKAVTPIVEPPQTATPVMNIASIGPNISRTAEPTLANAERLPFDHFVAGPPEATAFFKPPVVNDSSIRMALETRYTPEVIRTAENMSLLEFQKYATENPLVMSTITNSRATPASVWQASQIVKDIPANAIPTRFSPLGKTPMFTEVFDETLGKKVLVPIDQRVEGIIEQVKAMPFPRITELQFEPDQVKFLQSAEGKALLAAHDVHTNAEPLLTSKMATVTEEEADRMMNEAKPFDIVKQVSIKPSAEGERAINLRKKMGISSPELEGVTDAVKKKVPKAKQEKTLTDEIHKRCK